MRIILEPVNDEQFLAQIRMQGTTTRKNRNNCNTNSVVQFQYKCWQDVGLIFFCAPIVCTLHYYFIGEIDVSSSSCSSSSGSKIFTDQRQNMSSLIYLPEL